MAAQLRLEELGIEREEVVFNVHQLAQWPPGFVDANPNGRAAGLAHPRGPQIRIRGDPGLPGGETRQRAIHAGAAGAHPRATHLGARIAHLTKNAFGVLLLVAGLAMLILPGQGILTILAALALLDFPGKRAIERRILAYPAILSVANHLRARAGRPPLRIAPGTHESP